MHRVSRLPPLLRYIAALIASLLYSEEGIWPHCLTKSKIVALNHQRIKYILPEMTLTMLIALG